MPEVANQEQQQVLDRLIHAAARLDIHQLTTLAGLAEYLSLSPLDRSLMLAPVVPYSDDERAAVDAALADPRPSIPFEEMLKEFSG